MRFKALPSRTSVRQESWPAMAKLEAWAAWQRAATTAAQVFCCERRKGLNKDESTGYLLSGFMALSPVKVVVWQLHFYHRP
jgi:hypothetical protein